MNRRLPGGNALEKLAVGIDLGTTNSCIAVLRDGGPQVVVNDLGDSTTPSVVSVQKEGVVVGKKARKFVLTDPASTFVSTKRRMGQRWSREVRGKDYTPESISSLVLTHLKRNAEKKLGATISEAVITVPANFNSIQRQATKDAGEIAGLNVLRVINEPTAAALHYGHANDLSAIMVVFDLGGGTFDISVVEAADGFYEVIHSQGDNHLGGDDFNMRIVNWIVQQFATQTGHDIRRDTAAVQLVHEWAIAAKHGLTDAKEVRVKIDKLYKGKGFDEVLSRVLYRQLCSDLLERIRAVASSVADELSKPKYREGYPGAFENGMAGCDVLMVGGETRVGCIRDLVAQIYRGKIHRDTNPDEAVALGAALQAGIILKDGQVKDIVLVDTTALSLGTEVSGGIFSKLIEANSSIPASKTGEYSPVEDFQSSVLIKIYQGESELCEKNVKLGEFEFMLTPPRRAGEATIELTYHLDANDILHVNAVDKKTGVKQDMTIKGSQNLDRAEVEKLRKQAQQGSEDDRAKVKRIERRNQLSALVREVMVRLAEVAERDPKNKFVKKTEDYAMRLARALTDEDDDKIERAASDLEAAWQKLLASLPASAATPSQPQAASGAKAASGPKPGETVQCGNCGAQLMPGFAFCGKCGVPLKKENCSTCGAQLMEGFEFCGKCGGKV